MVSLEDLYNGKTTKIKLSKNILCSTCNGMGGKVGAVQKCVTCKGRGIRIIHRQLAPGMLQQLQSMCTDCSGEGEVINEKDRCKKCQGSKVVKDSKILEVHVDKGMQHGQKIHFTGEGDQAPNMDPGDIIFELKQKAHATYSRKENDLIMTHKIGLVEALCGFQFTIKHLDNRRIVIKCPAGKVVEPGSKRVVRGQGMPQHRNPFEKGDLYIEFDVHFPEEKWTSLEKLKELEALLPERSKEEVISSDTEEVELQDYNQSSAGFSSQKHDSYEENDEYEGGGDKVQCQHQ